MQCLSLDVIFSQGFGARAHFTLPTPVGGKISDWRTELDPAGVAIEKFLPRFVPFP